ncbi:hypothetical protein YC2023_100078 [Brassica napus]
MYHEYTAVRLIQRTTKSEPMKIKNSEMKQSKKLLEDIAGIAGNCLTVCPSQEGSKCKEKMIAFNRKGTGGILDIWSHHRGILRQCPQESPLANGQILIDGQGIEIIISQLSKRRISGILDKISQAAREESQGVSWIRWYEAQFIQLAVGSKSVSGGFVIAEQFVQMVEQRYLCR